MEVKSQNISFSLGIIAALFIMIGCGSIDRNTIVKDSVQPHAKEQRAALADWTWSVDTQININDNGADIATFYYDNTPDEIVHFQLFLDTKPNEGYHGSKSWGIFGADYLIEDGRIYQSLSDSEWNWKLLDTIEMFDSHKAEGTREVAYHDSALLASLLTDNQVDIYLEVFDKGWNGQYETISFKNTPIHRQDGVIQKPKNEAPEDAKADEDNAGFGVRHVSATSVDKGTVFASVGGGGDCSHDDPCSIYTAFDRVEAGSVLFLRGGTYDIDSTLELSDSGEEGSPIIIESYPGEKAILDGGATHDDATERSKGFRSGIRLDGKEYIKIRKLEIKNMPAKGIFILRSSFTSVEGCQIHDNFYTGVHIGGGRENLIVDNKIYQNSDAGLWQEATRYIGYKDGNNADGISITSGEGNKAIHNTVYKNSDDGIDTWKSNSSYVAYNAVSYNGLASGDGNGIKTGGDKHYLYGELPSGGKWAVVEHNIAHHNQRHGFDVNQGREVTFKYNVSHDNVKSGYYIIHDTHMQENVSYDNRDDVRRYLGEDGIEVVEGLTK